LQLLLSVDAINFGEDFRVVDLNPLEVEATSDIVVNCAVGLT